ncbi:hypothetical protein SADUNF_Sadunf01G0091000 [Salix dunnii]|uniref:TPX2 central domain-containing protein n=1 Tax=Salix dunnii TaxID=1413687 RepID=A0A835NAL7_9ROSI|nr:hypothetical protein SADUNF_Sadunf01G0091000 [Salix dunnii]
MVFEALEVDLDYEFDAPKYFDFTRRESIVEARDVQRWFDTAPSCPTSPFVAKFAYSLQENVNTSPKSKDEENRATLLNDDMGPEVSAIEVDDRECEGIYRGIFTNIQSGNLQKVSNQRVEIATGLTFYHHKSTDKSNPRVKSTVKSTFPRSSSLMKPTASQLAKQNQPSEIGVSRFQILLGQKERSLCNTSALESHPAKRQKLEGDHFCKIGDGKQQIDFIHKTSKKDGLVDKISSHAKLRLTVPREPDLVTAHRAQRMRPKEQQYMAPRRFKARPLNRKILEAPSLPLLKKSTPKLPEFQEFHLKTLERAMQHNSSTSLSSFKCNDSNKGLDKPCTISESVKTESRRPTTMGPPKQDGCGATCTFKACPLNKKIFSSKGEMGVFRTSVRETTVPKEFNFHTEKRFQPNPPADLFSKGPKENRLNPLQTEQKKVHLVKERQSIFGGKQQIQYGSNMGTNEVCYQSIRRYELGHPVRFENYREWSMMSEHLDKN